MRAKIIAVDFDGTLVENKWPDIGATNEKVLDYCKSERAKGARIILWTNRVGEPLTNAIKWCQDHGLLLDAINDNIQESIDFFGFNTRKIYADEFIDDRMAKGFDLPYVPKKECTDQRNVSQRALKVVSGKVHGWPRPDHQLLGSRDYAQCD